MDRESSRRCRRRVTSRNAGLVGNTAPESRAGQWLALERESRHPPAYSLTHLPFFSSACQSVCLLAKQTSGVESGSNLGRAGERHRGCVRRVASLQSGLYWVRSGHIGVMSRAEHSRRLAGSGSRRFGCSRKYDPVCLPARRALVPAGRAGEHGFGQCSERRPCPRHLGVCDGSPSRSPFIDIGRCISSRWSSLRITVEA